MYYNNGMINNHSIKNLLDEYKSKVENNGYNKFETTQVEMSEMPYPNYSQPNSDNFNNMPNMSNSDQNFNNIPNMSNPDQNFNNIPNMTNPNQNFNNIPNMTNPDQNFNNIPNMTNPDQNFNNIPNMSNPSQNFNNIPNMSNPNQNFNNIPNAYNPLRTCILKRELELMKNLYLEINSILYPLVVQVLDEYEYVGSPMYSYTGLDRESLNQLIDRVIILGRSYLDEIDEIYLRQNPNINIRSSWEHWGLLRSNIESLLLTEIFTNRRPVYFNNSIPNIF